MDLSILLNTDVLLFLQLFVLTKKFSKVNFFNTNYKFISDYIFFFDVSRTLIYFALHKYYVIGGLILVSQQIN